MNVKNSSQNTVKKYEELTFTDDFMFCKVMQNNPDLCKHLIELIIGKKITMITYPDTQKAIEITSRTEKGIRMDVYVEGDEGTIYDIEMQTSMLSNLNKRARYYQGMIDLNTIERGADYKELRKTYIIFFVNLIRLDRLELNTHLCRLVRRIIRLNSVMMHILFTLIRLV